MSDKTKEKRAGFTQGPWKVANRNYISSQAGGFSVAQTVDLPGQDENEAQANAHLIASAPELHAQVKLFERALDELAKQADDSRTGGCAYAEQSILTLEALGIDKEKLREVLAKADGREA